MTRGLRHGMVGLALAVGISPILMTPGQTLAGQTSGESHKAGQRLEGRWVVRTTRTNPTPPTPPTFLGLMTFWRTGQMIEETNTPTIRTVAHGEWVRTGDRRFTRSMLSFRFDPSRTFVGFSLVTVDMRLNRKGDRFVGEGVVQRFDTAGVLQVTDSSREDGRRCRVAATLAQCLEFD
jgi:hypothetical protein